MSTDAPKTESQVEKLRRWASEERTYANGLDSKSHLVRDMYLIRARHLEEIADRLERES